MTNSETPALALEPISHVHVPAPPGLGTVERGVRD